MNKKLEKLNQEIPKTKAKLGRVEHKIFYKQPARRDRGGACSMWALDDRKLPLASECDVLGGWEPDDREAGIL